MRHACQSGISSEGSFEKKLLANNNAGIVVSRNERGCASCMPLIPRHIGRSSMAGRKIKPPLSDDKKEAIAF